MRLAEDRWVCEEHGEVVPNWILDIEIKNKRKPKSKPVLIKSLSLTCFLLQGLSGALRVEVCRAG